MSKKFLYGVKVRACTNKPGSERVPQGVKNNVVSGIFNVCVQPKGLHRVGELRGNLFPRCAVRVQKDMGRALVAVFHVLEHCVNIVCHEGVACLPAFGIPNGYDTLCEVQIFPT
jgi:hypothetical protein